VSTITPVAGVRTPQLPARERFPKLAEVIDYLNGLTGRADLARLTQLLSELNVTRADIEPACTFGARGYRRNTICETPWFELLALCWRSGDVTAIHDHRGVSCSFRVIEGTGTEIRYTQRESGQVCPVSVAEMHPGYICAADDADIHQVANLQAPGKDLVTLHIYSPPIRGMTTYGQLRPREHAPLECDPAGQEWLI
jgi:cysteine dioxygenase